MEEGGEWRMTVKERERERRRMRDRQRRQSMSIEERERHLARRRRNYQLRRQRAAMSDHDQLQAIKNIDTSTSTEQLPSTSKHNLPEANPLQHAVRVVAADHNYNASPASLHPLLLSGESTYSRRSYKYPRVLRLTQIKRLARLLNNSQLQKPTCTAGGRLLQGSTEPADHSRSYKDIIMASPQSNLMIKGIRLIHVKRLARALSSSVPKTLMHKDDHPCRTQGMIHD